MRGFVDHNLGTAKFLGLGSASLDLLKQSSESLVGSIIYVVLTPFLSSEARHLSQFNLYEYWISGGIHLVFWLQPEKYLIAGGKISSLFLLKKIFLSLDLHRFHLFYIIF